MKTFMKIISLVMFSAFIIFAVAGQVDAKWPERPITMVIPFGAGGGTDTITRSYAKEMEKYLGVTITCINRTGAGGALAMDLVSKQPADGYWLLSIGSFAKSLRVMGRTKSISWKDWQFYKAANGIVAWAVKPDSPFKTFADFLDAARTNPNKYTISAASVGTIMHEGNVIMMNEAKIRARTVHYKSGAASVLACLQGEVDISGVGLHEEIEFIRAGKLRLLAVFAKKSIKLKDGKVLRPIGDFVPSAFKYAPFGPEYCFAVKRNVPSEVLEKLKNAFAAAINSPNFENLLKKRFFFKNIVVGEEADRLGALRESVTAWLLWDLKLPSAKVNPADLGIPKAKDFDSWWPPEGYKPRFKSD